MSGNSASGVKLDIGKKYYDDMDPSRSVIPVSVDGNEVKCRVFFGSVYFGTTILPRCLFDGNVAKVGNYRNNRTYNRIGFSDTPPQPYVRKPKPNKDINNQREDGDDV